MRSFLVNPLRGFGNFYIILSPRVETRGYLRRPPAGAGKRGLLRRSRPGPTYRMPIVLGRREWFKRLRKVMRGSPATAGKPRRGEPTQRFGISCDDIEFFLFSEQR